MGAERYRDECSGRSPDKIAHPTGWLRDMRWRDEPAPPSSVQATGGQRLSCYDQIMLMQEGAR